MGSSFRQKLIVAATVVLALCPLSACASSGSGTANQSLDDLKIMVPSQPGGGYDITARASAKALHDAKIVGDVEVSNVPGASGTIALAQLMSSASKANLVMQMGQGVVGGAYSNHSPFAVGDATPIALLYKVPNVIVVPGASGFASLADLVKAWKKDPATFTVAGGAAPGGSDYLALMAFAKSIGVDPQDVNFIPYDGSGEQAAALLGNKVTFGVASAEEFADDIQSGKLRALAVTSAQRVGTIDAPTLKESGVDIETGNWRGVIAPPKISDQSRQMLIDVYTRLHDSPEWKSAVSKFGWEDNFITGEAFGRFIQSETENLKTVMQEAGQ
jgi:putative tricarboxylic transport membrane protein